MQGQREKAECGIMAEFFSNFLSLKKEITSSVQRTVLHKRIRLRITLLESINAQIIKNDKRSSE